MFKSVVLQGAVAASIAREMAKVAITETGGALAGHIDGDRLIVTSASGPGSRAELRMRSVLIDGEHAQRFCDNVRARTNGKDDYVGDWHCHLGYSLRPSDLDYDAMRTMATFEFTPTTTPVSIIWSKWSRNVHAFYYDGSPKLRKISLVCST